MKTALTMPAECSLAKESLWSQKQPGYQPVSGKPWYNKFLAACLPFEGSSSLMLPTMTEKARMKTPMSMKRPSAAT